MGIKAMHALAVVLLLPGCFWVTTKHEGQTMRQDIDKLNSQLSVQDESVQEKVKRLDGSLDKATKLLSRNSADLGAEIEALSSEVAQLAGKISALQRDVETSQADHARMKAEFEERILSLNTRLAEAEKKALEKPPPPAMTKSELFSAGATKFKAKQYAASRREFQKFYKENPAAARADNALYWIGTSYARENNHEKAIAAYQRVIDRHPDGDMVDDAFFAAGTAAASMKWCTDARAYFGVLVKRFPKSPFVRRAQDQLKRLKRSSKNKRICQS